MYYIVVRAYTGARVLPRNMCVVMGGRRTVKKRAKCANATEAVICRNSLAVRVRPPPPPPPPLPPRPPPLPFRHAIPRRRLELLLPITLYERFVAETDIAQNHIFEQISLYFFTQYIFYRYCISTYFGGIFMRKPRKLS